MSTGITLRPYQADGAAWLRDKNGLLAWEPGVGKTFTALEAARELGGAILYICPAALRWQVQEEACRLDPHMTTQVLETGATPINDRADLVVVSYDVAMSKVMWRELFKRQWGALILDEATAIKNRDAKRTHAIYGALTISKGALYRRAKRTWAMTGTPIMNSPADLWTHYSRLFPQAILHEGKPLRFRQWVDRFCLVRHTNFGTQIVGGQNLPELQQLLSPHMHRLRRSDVLKDMPPLTIDTAPLRGETLSFKQISPEDQDLIRAALPRLEFEDDALSELAPAMATIRRAVGLAKANAVVELVKSELWSGHEKVVVFGYHTDALKLIHEGLRNYSPVLITGADNGVERSKKIQTFQTQSKARVFVAQIRAAGMGLNLQMADRVIIAEPDWTPAVNDQAIARVYRSGQRNPVRATFVSVKGTLDDQITKALARKSAIVNQVIDRKAA